MKRLHMLSYPCDLYGLNAPYFEYLNDRIPRTIILSGCKKKANKNSSSIDYYNKDK